MAAGSLLPITLTLLVSVPTTARAERPPEPKQDADLVVNGRVGKVYTNSDSTDVNYYDGKEDTHSIQRPFP